MKSFGLLAALGALLASAPQVNGTGRQAKLRRSETAGQRRAAARLDRYAELRSIERAVLLHGDDDDAWFHSDERHEMQMLRITRGRLARRMGRQRARAERKKGSAPKEARPLRIGDRIPRASRVAILRADGRPVSGRQWRKLVKAERRRELAA